jgi:ABC-type sulfate transport system substrate-binding protein
MIYSNRSSKNTELFLREFCRMQNNKEVVAWNPYSADGLMVITNEPISAGHVKFAMEIHNKHT